MTARQLIVVSDLDGTLLDQQTYACDASLPAVRRLRSLNIPLILCSSKTRSEILPLWRRLGLSDPFIVENGGAIFIARRAFPFPVPGSRARESFEVLDLGTEISVLRRTLVETARECGVKVRSFGAMTPDEISALTGLAREQAALAAVREYDEPFVAEGGDRERLFAALRGKGLNVVQGDRFSHLTGGHDKGRAVGILLDLYRRAGRPLLSVGLGNSANDLPFLSRVDRPIVVRNPDGSWDREIVAKVPTVQRTQGIGPQGWREAVEDLLASEGLEG